MLKEPFKIVSDAINQNVDAFPENQAEDVIFCYWMDNTSFSYSTLLSNKILTVRDATFLGRDAYPYMSPAI